MAAKPPDLDSLLECPICLSECEDPRVLPCLHTLCLKCLDQHINTSAESSTFFCPSCRHKCEVPAGGVTSVPKNFFLNSLREILQKQGSRERLPLSSQISTLEVDRQQCSNSRKDKTHDEKAAIFCVDCSKFYCADCESIHSRFEEFSAHQLVPVSSADTSVIKAAVSRKTPPKCDQHSTLPTDMYCDTCRVPVCLKCCVLKHKQHEYREIEGAAGESKSLLSTLTKTAENITSRLDKNMQELDKSEKSISTDSDEACRQVQENAEEIRALVTQREKSVVQEIRQAQTTSLTQLKAAYKEAEINKAAVESLLSYIQALLVSEDVTSQVVHAPGLQEQLRQHEVAPLQSVTLEVNLERKTQNLSALNAMIGAVSVRQTTATSGSLEGAVPEEMKVPLGSPVQHLKPDVGGGVTGLVMMGDCVYATGWDQPYLTIRNIKTNNHKRHTLDGLGARGMTLVHGDTLVITDSNKRLHLIKTDQEMNIKEHVTKDITFEPNDVNVDPVSGKLIIANKTDKQIAICDSHGDIGEQIPVKTSVERLRCAVATSDGYIVLDWASTGKLHWLNKDGDVMHTYSESLCWPHDAVLDSQGRVIIADQHHHQVHLVDANKDLSHCLLTEADGIRYPTCVQLDEVNARLCVGYRDTSRACKVSVYKWPFVSSSSPGEHTSLTHHKLRVELVRYQ